MSYQEWPLASNSATGPAAAAATTTTGVNVTWATIAGGPSSGASVQITPKVTNRIRVMYSVEVQGSVATLSSALLLNSATVAAGGNSEVQLTGATGVATLSAVWVGTLTTTLGSAQNFQVQVTGSVGTIVASGACISIEELAAANADCG